MDSYLTKSSPISRIIIIAFLIIEIKIFKRLLSTTKATITQPKLIPGVGSTRGRDLSKQLFEKISWGKRKCEVFLWKRQIGSRKDKEQWEIDGKKRRIKAAAEVLTFKQSYKAAHILLVWKPSKHNPYNATKAYLIFSKESSKLIPPTDRIIRIGLLLAIHRPSKQ